MFDRFFVFLKNSCSTGSHINLLLFRMKRKSYYSYFIFCCTSSGYVRNWFQRNPSCGTPVDWSALDFSCSDEARSFSLDITHEASAQTNSSMKIHMHRERNICFAVVIKLIWCFFCTPLRHHSDVFILVLLSLNMEHERIEITGSLFFLI